MDHLLFAPAGFVALVIAYFENCPKIYNPVQEEGLLLKTKKLKAGTNAKTPPKKVTHIGVTSPGKEVTMNLLAHWPDLLTVQEADQILWTDSAQVDSFIKAGAIGFTQIAGKTLIPRRFLENFLIKQHHIQTAQKQAGALRLVPCDFKRNFISSRRKIWCEQHHRTRKLFLV